MLSVVNSLESLSLTSKTTRNNDRTLFYKVYNGYDYMNLHKNEVFLVICKDLNDDTYVYGINEQHVYTKDFKSFISFVHKSDCLDMNLNTVVRQIIFQENSVIRVKENPDMTFTRETTKCFMSVPFMLEDMIPVKYLI